MAITAFAIFDANAFGGPINASADGIRFNMQAVFKDTVLQTSELVQMITVDIPNGTADSGILALATTAVVDAGVASGFNVPRAGVRLPAFSVGQ